MANDLARAQAATHPRQQGFIRSDARPQSEESITQPKAVLVPAFALKITLDSAGVLISTADGSPMSEERAQALVEHFVGAPWRTIPVPSDNGRVESRLPRIVDETAE